MKVEIDLTANIHKREDIDVLYCTLCTCFPTVFNCLEEKEFSVRLKHLHIKWSGILKCSKVNVEAFSNNLKRIFDHSGLKKYRFCIFANEKEYIF